MENAETLNESIEKLPPELQREVIDYIEFLTEKYRNTAPPSQNEEHGSMPGLFSAEPELMDQICASAMNAREQHPLRPS